MTLLERDPHPVGRCKAEAPIEGATVAYGFRMRPRCDAAPPALLLHSPCIIELSLSIHSL